MNKNKIISSMLAAATVAQMFTVAVGAEETIYQTPVDISTSFNAKVYLSKENEKTEVEVNKPDYFVGDINKDMPPIAINRDNLEKICTNGVLTYNGVNYLMPMPEKSNGGIYSYWQEIDVPDDYYSDLKLLAFSNNPNPEKIYVDVVYADGTNELKSIMVNSRSADKGNKSGFIDDVGVLAAKENTEVSGSGNLYEYTIKDLNFEKKVAKIKPGYGGDYAGAQARILALTCIKPTNNQLDEKIGEKLADLPTLEELEISDEEKLNGAKLYADMLNERNASENVYENLKKYNTYRRRMNELTDLSVPLDLVYNARVYLSESNKNSLTSVEKPHYFLDTSTGEGVATAISKESLRGYLTNGLFTYNNVKYQFPIVADTTDTADTKAGGLVPAWQSIYPKKDYYSEYRFLIFSNNPAGETIYVNTIYEDGSEYLGSFNTNNRSSAACEVSLLSPIVGGSCESVGNIYEYVCKVNDQTKKVSRVTVGYGGNSPIKKAAILSMTGIRLSNAELDKRLSQLLSEVTPIESIGLNAYVNFDKINEIASALNEREALAQDYSGLTKYNEYKSRFDSLTDGTEVKLYVSPQGNDESTTDEPLKTLKRAKEVIKALKTDYPNKTYRVIFKEGEYSFEDTVVFDESDYGFEENPVIYEGESGKNVRFIASKEIDLSQAGEISDESIKSRLKQEVQDKIVEIDLKNFGINEVPEFKAHTRYEAYQESAMITLSGKEQPIAQYPNGDGEYSVWEEIVTTGGAEGSTEGGTIKISGDEITKWTNAEGIYLGGYFGSDYRYERANVSEIDTENKTITLKGGTDGGINNVASRRWKAFNVLEELDTEGEWYIDKNTLILYYYIPENIGENEKLEISTYSNSFLRLNSTKNITFKNISFENAIGTAVEVNNTAKNVSFIGCGFKNISQTAMKTNGRNVGTFEEYYNYLEAPSDFVISDCDFYNIGSYAVFMTGGNRQTLTPSNNKISNNYLNKISQKAKNMPAIILQGGMGAVVENNLIRNTPFHAINIFGNEHQIRYNEIENACNEATDASVIYSGRSYVMRGNEISYNFIHDFRVHGDKIPLEQTSAIYLDDMMSGFNVHHNIIVNGQTGIHISGGQDNDIENNIIVGVDRVFYTGNPGEDPNKLGNLGVVANQVLTEYPQWAERYPDLVKTAANPGPPSRNVIRNNLSDITPAIIQRFTDCDGITQPNYVETGDIYADSKNLDYRVLSSADITTKAGVLTNANFDINNIGLQISENRASVKNVVEGELEFKKYYPENGESINPFDCVFVWEESKSADSYKLVIAEDEQMQRVMFEQEVNDTRCHVKNINSDAQKLYWQVFAINKSRTDNITYAAQDLPRSISIHQNWIWQSSLKPCIPVELSGNTKMFIEEGTTDTDNSYADDLAMNLTSLKKMLDKNGGALEKNGAFYQLNSDYMPKKGKSGLFNSFAITLNPEKCREVTFIANSSELITDYPITVTYTDNTTAKASVNIGAQNSMSDGNGGYLTNVFKIGAVNSQSGKAQSGGYIYQYTITTDSSKTVMEISFGSISKRDEINIFAISLVLNDSEKTSDAKISYNTCITTNAVDTPKAYFKTTEENQQILEGKTDIFGNGKIKVLKITTPFETESGFDLFLWKNLESLMPMAYKITRR